jgi:hypothetical protein
VGLQEQTDSDIKDLEEKSQSQEAAHQQRLLSVVEAAALSIK